MTKLKKGDTARIHYTGTLEDGRVFDSSRSREPLEFKVGGGRVITGLEIGVEGMEVGENRNLEIPPDKAYGFRREELVIKVPAGEFPDHITPDVGTQFQVKQQDGSVFGIVVTEVSGEEVTLDANHPLAGQTLYFQVELLEIPNSS